MQYQSEYQHYSSKTRKNHSKIYMVPEETKKPNNSEQQDQSSMYYNHGVQDILQNHSVKTSILLEQGRMLINGTEFMIETTLGISGHLIVHEGAKNIYWRKDSLFRKWCYENWLSTFRRMNLNPVVQHVLKCISNLKKTETIILL